LIVRGACALRPGLRGISSRIRVRSIVGRFLEHSRIFAFANRGKPEVYLGSADWMPRNFYERVEVMFPLNDPALCQEVCVSVLAPYFADTAKTRFLAADGTYERAGKIGSASHSRNGNRFNVQEYFIGLADGREERRAASSLRRFIGRQSSPIFDLLMTKWDEIQRE